MKELTIEEKAKRYDEALAFMQGWILDENGLVHVRPEEIFPELKESEDERIRKGLVDYFNNFHLQTFAGIDPKKILSWLEEQSEHANFRNKIQVGDKVTRNDNGELVNLSQLNRVAKPCKGEQKSAWSVKDETALGDALWCCNQAASIAKDENDMGNAWYAERWLKSLKERYTWKPSKEQFAALFDCQRYIPETNSLERKLIGELYQDLKKLKG